MLAQAPIIGFVPVRDFDIAEEFYSGCLGLRVLERDGFALVLEAAGGVMIRCVQVPDAQPAKFTILGWEVSDIHSEVQHLRAAGVEPTIYTDFGPHFKQDEDGVWTSPNGAEVVWFSDPFGNVLSLSKHPGRSAGAEATGQ